MNQKPKKIGLTSAPKDLKFGNRSVTRGKKSFQTKTTNYSSTMGADFTIPSLWKSFKVTRSPKVLLNSMLYSKYSSSQNYHYLKDINDILLHERTPSTLAYKQSEELLNQSENLDTFFDLEEYTPQMEDIVEYYKYHNEIPRYFGKDIYQIYFDHYDKKRKLNYRRITRKMKVENGEDPNESRDRELAKKRNKYYTPMLLNLTKIEDYRKKEAMRRKENLGNTIENIYRCFKGQEDNSGVQFCTPRSINSISFKYTDVSENIAGNDFGLYFDNLKKTFSREAKEDSRYFKKKKNKTKNVVKGRKRGKRLTSFEKGKKASYDFSKISKDNEERSLKFMEMFGKFRKAGENVDLMVKKTRNNDKLGNKFSNAFKDFTSTFETIENLKGHKKSRDSKKSSKKTTKSNSNSKFFKTMTTKKGLGTSKNPSKSQKKTKQKSLENSIRKSSHSKSKNLNKYTNIFKNLKSFRSLDQQKKRKSLHNMVGFTKSKKGSKGMIVVKSQRHKRSKSDYNSFKQRGKKTVSYRNKYSTTNFIKDIEEQAIKKMNKRLKTRKNSLNNLKQKKYEGVKPSVRTNTKSLRSSRLDLKNFETLDYKTKLELFRQKRRPSKNSSYGTRSKNSSLIPSKMKTNLNVKGKQVKKRREKINTNSVIGQMRTVKKASQETETFNGNVYEIRQKLKKRKMKGKRADLMKSSLNCVGLKMNLFRDKGLKQIFNRKET